MTSMQNIYLDEAEYFLAHIMVKPLLKLLERFTKIGTLRKALE